MMSIEPATLTGRIVRLEPLSIKYAADLYQASRDPSIWTYKMIKQPASLSEMEQLVASTVQSKEAGACLPFTIIDLAGERPIGETRYHSFLPHDRGLEIGWTWLTPSVQRTGVNTECKYLLLRHAFEVWNAARVQFRTHHLNVRSQRAIERLGAVKEGILRNHVIMPDGSFRHSVYYSIIESEWPQVKQGLEARMSATYPTQ